VPRKSAGSSVPLIKSKGKSVKFSFVDTEAGVIVVDRVAERVLSSSVSVSTVIATGSSMSSGTVKRSF